MDECEERRKDSTKLNLHYRPLFFLYKRLNEDPHADILSPLLTRIPRMWSHSVKGAVDYPRQGWNWLSNGWSDFKGWYSRRKNLTYTDGLPLTLAVQRISNQVLTEPGLRV